MVPDGIRGLLQPGGRRRFAVDFDISRAAGGDVARRVGRPCVDRPGFFERDWSGICRPAPAIEAVLGEHAAAAAGVLTLPDGDGHIVMVPCAGRGLCEAWHRWRYLVHVHLELHSAGYVHRLIECAGIDGFGFRHRQRGGVGFPVLAVEAIFGAQHAADSVGTACHRDSDIVLAPLHIGGFRDGGVRRLLPVDLDLYAGNLRQVARLIPSAGKNLRVLSDGERDIVGLPVPVIEAVLGAGGAAARVRAMRDGYRHIIIRPFGSRGLGEHRRGRLYPVDLYRDGGCIRYVPGYIESTGVNRLGRSDRNSRCVGCPVGAVGAVLGAGNAGAAGIGATGDCDLHVPVMPLGSRALCELRHRGLFLINIYCHRLHR